MDLIYLGHDTPEGGGCTGGNKPSSYVSYIDLDGAGG